MFIYLILIIYMIQVRADPGQNYEVIKNRDILSSFNNSITSISKRQSLLLCLAACNKDSDCLTSVFNKKNQLYFKFDKEVDI